MRTLVSGYLTDRSTLRLASRSGVPRDCRDLILLPATRVQVLRVSRRLKSIDVIDVLSGLFILRGVPGHIRSDNGPEFVAKAVQEWIGAVGAQTAYITPGSPWRTASSKASMRACVTNSSTARSSTRCTRPDRHREPAPAFTMLSGRMPRSVTTLQLPRCSCQRSPHGRLATPDQLRRPYTH
jgi:hypothetical protein